MDDVKGRVSLKIDLSTGTIELDAPAESFNDAIEKTKELAATLDLRNRASSKPEASPASVASSTTVPASPIDTGPTVQHRAKTRGVAKSGGRAGRIGSYEPVAGLLDEPQEIELRAFITEKAPSEQSDRVLVALVKGEQLLGRKGLIYNEIYTLMWLGGIKDLPKALDVVLGKMIQDQLIVRDNVGFASKFIGRNRVENDLPRRE